MFRHLKVGDRVTRSIGGHPMPMIVREVTDDLIICDALNFAGGWTFDRATGVEEDADLGWGVKFGRTGSFLVLEG